ncbi:alpha-mannosidase 2-like [Anticarsia gemmatalis]|uniref:alpha-mannosidase 2-like n=1 Tax=Anticarsia gemmatalis TaxID=129554 RepID=UPI003F76906D
MPWKQCDVERKIVKQLFITNTQISLSAAMGSDFRLCASLLLFLLVSTKVTSYEKTLRKIIRSQSKMVPRPFSENSGTTTWKNNSFNTARYKEALMFPSVAQSKSVYHNMPRPRISTILSTVETSRSKSSCSQIRIRPNDQSNERLARDTNTSSPLRNNEILMRDTHNIHMNKNNMTIKNFYQIPTQSRFFPPIDDRDNSYEQKSNSKENTVIIPESHGRPKDNGSSQVKAILIPKSTIQTAPVQMNNRKTTSETPTIIDIESDLEKADFFIEGVNMDSQKFSYNLSVDSFTCLVIKETKADIDAQEKFSQFNIEPTWSTKRHYWNTIFDSRYESLMRNPKWPSLKVILIPRVHVDTIWKKTFEQYHKDSVNKILSNIVKKLQFYDRLTFSWNEISHLSQWWKTASHRSRLAFRKLLKGGRLEITTGGYVEPDEATTHLFGLVHQLIEGHQWLKIHLNYTPKVAWLTNSVSHSPTMAYLLSTLNIHKLVTTNLHFSWEKYLAEYQYSDFIWVQNWDQDKSFSSKLNEELSKIGNDRHPKHAVLTHFLQFNTAGFKACGPDNSLCALNYNFAIANKNLDIGSFNIKEKAEQLLEQYSKTGTISQHNTIIAPLGGPYHYEIQPELDFQYNNYLKLADFINANKNIYKATVDFGTVQDYFTTIIDKYKKYPTVKGDFLNFADISSGSPAYWTGFYTTRPFTKILLRRLQSTLRSTEILFSFALNFNVFRGFNLTEIFELLLKSRETVARLLDRNVVSGTVTANVLKYVHSQILTTVKNCWYIQELAASFLALKPDINMPHLQKYVYRDGEFISVFKSISPGDQIYIFNSLSHERTEIVEIVTRFPNVRIMDHNKKDVIIQINPIWKYNSDNLIELSHKFFKISFAVMVPPMTMALFKVKETYDAAHHAATLYCLSCIADEPKNVDSSFTFNIEPIQSGDIQLESYKHRLIFDEYTGFLKTVVEKETNFEKTVFIDYGAFRDSHYNTGMFLFNTNVSKPLQDILRSYRMGKKSKIILIVSGQVSTELITIYGRLLQHTTKIFNLQNCPLTSAIYLESKIDYEVSPKYRESEMFLSIQTDIINGNPPQIFIDNNSFQYTSRILNISRRVESNMYPITSMAYIEDGKSRLTFITDHAQGVTALQEGQLVVMLDRRVLFDDGRGTDEGLADSSKTCHRHYILLENLFDARSGFGKFSFQDQLHLPTLNALHLANTIGHLLDIFVIDKNYTSLCNYMFMPLIKTAFPCDVAIVNYRVLLNRGSLQYFTPNAALLVLHRQSFSCQINPLNLNCQGDSSFALDKILRNIKAIYKTNLAGTNEGEPRLHFNLGNFPPMELMTLRIDF